MGGGFKREILKKEGGFLHEKQKVIIVGKEVMGTLVSEVGILLLWQQNILWQKI